MKQNGVYYEKEISLHPAGFAAVIVLTYMTGESITEESVKKQGWMNRKRKYINTSTT